VKVEEEDGVGVGVESSSRDGKGSEVTDWEAAEDLESLGDTLGDTLSWGDALLELIMERDSVGEAEGEVLGLLLTLGDMDGERVVQLDRELEGVKVPYSRGGVGEVVFV